MDLTDEKKFRLAVKEIVETVRENEKDCTHALDKRKAEIGVLYTQIEYHSTNPDKLEENELHRVFASVLQTAYSLGYVDAKNKYAI